MDASTWAGPKRSTGPALSLVSTEAGANGRQALASVPSSRKHRAVWSLVAPMTPKPTVPTMVNDVEGA